MKIEITGVITKSTFTQSWYGATHEIVIVDPATQERTEVCLPLHSEVLHSAKIVKLTIETEDGQ